MNKQSLSVTAIIGFLMMVLLLAGCGAATETGNANRIDAKVIKVVDSDTIKVKMGNTEETVRMLLIDGPETVHPSKPVQPFGPEASDFAKKTLSNQTVQLELDVSERDKYGRLLAYVWIDDRMFNEMALERGLVRVAYVYAPNVKYVDQFRNIQKKAQQQGIGIWSIENYVQDDGFHPEEAEASSGAPASGEAAAEEDVPAAACANPTIKGNINAKGDKIYHVPGNRSYEQTKAEEMFCTEAEAVAAGFRKPKS
ncbi:micrococcal nuclease [Paenibacillus phyllosphaerae]|uniref:Micrococcal nuclease n=1 Tax=Paenibacillus phyllosphaerae TaxID=274593 RepID=A0A7W5FLW7_9BACL|nr:thermonuclease family protein [Paenibacillus phyllosphaerae]MBB3109616.1 micrococcal nuclease [Paenibacillus phyllosphaerae]